MDLCLEDGRRVGTVSLQRQGSETTFAVSAVLPTGLWRIVARGSAGELALGVTEGGAVSMQRRFSALLTDRLGAVEQVTACRCTGARMESEWQACRSADVPSLPPLPPGSLCRRRGKGRLLALPWRPDGPFPWPELFCLARVGPMAGRCWVFYALNEDGAPVFSEES